jgi:hypothetical protein
VNHDDRHDPEPLTNVEGNWHGDSEGDPKLVTFRCCDLCDRISEMLICCMTSAYWWQLNYIEWLSCMLRMAIVGYGTVYGSDPDEAVERLAEDLLLNDTIALKNKVYLNCCRYAFFQTS